MIDLLSPMERKALESLTVDGVREVLKANGFTERVVSEEDPPGLFPGTEGLSSYILKKGAYSCILMERRRLEDGTLEEDPSYRMLAFVRRHAKYHKLSTFEALGFLSGGVYPWAEGASMAETEETS